MEVSEKPYCEILLQFKMVFWVNILIYFCDAKLNFKHDYSSLQCHMLIYY